MTSPKKKTSPEGGRNSEYDRQVKKANTVLGDLDFIDDLPDPPKRVEIPIPYGTDGVPPRPFGWDIRR